MRTADKGETGVRQAAVVVGISIATQDLKG
jgi:hypothetical protein